MFGRRLIKSNDEGGGASFNTVTYTGNGSTQSITGVGFQPDFVWIKSRSATTSHKLTDIVRATTKGLVSNTAAAETTDSNGLTAFGSDGFTLGTDSVYNNSGATYVAWCFRAGGSSISNTNGSITSNVSKNNIAGISIVKYTGTGTAATIGHGLDVAPSLIIIKNLDSTTDWYVYSSGLTSNAYYLKLNSQSSEASDSTVFNSTSPTSTVFSIGTSTGTNGVNSLIAYCFSEISGFSKIGSYTGNGNGSFDSTGLVIAQTITTGFEPAFVMIRKTNSAEQWMIFDNKRGGSSPGSEWLFLFANLSNSEANSQSGGGYSQLVSYTSTAFTLGNDPSLQVNASGDTYIYMAFANQF